MMYGYDEAYPSLTIEELQALRADLAVRLARVNRALDVMTDPVRRVVRIDLDTEIGGGFTTDPRRVAEHRAIMVFSKPDLTLPAEEDDCMGYITAHDAGRAIAFPEAFWSFDIVG